MRVAALGRLDALRSGHAAAACLRIPCTAVPPSGARPQLPRRRALRFLRVVGSVHGLRRSLHTRHTRCARQRRLRAARRVRRRKAPAENRTSAVSSDAIIACGGGGGWTVSCVEGGDNQAALVAAPRRRGMGRGEATHREADKSPRRRRVIPAGKEGGSGARRKSQGIPKRGCGEVIFSMDSNCRELCPLGPLILAQHPHNPLPPP